jgi:hypothetical protein
MEPLKQKKQNPLFTAKAQRTQRKPREKLDRINRIDRMKNKLLPLRRRPLRKAAEVMGYNWFV